MAAVSQPRTSGIPQPVSKGRGSSRLASMQSQFQQREAADRQRKLAELAPARGPSSETARPSAAAERTAAEPGPRGAAPQRQPAAAPARGRVTNGSGGVTVSAGGRAAPSAPSSSSSPAGSGGKVRAMFQTRRTGTAGAQQTSPIGWDKSYPLDPIKKSAPARSAAPAPASVSDPTALGASDSGRRRTLSDEDLWVDASGAGAGSMRGSATAPELAMPEIRVERGRVPARERQAERQRINAELRRRDRELLARIRKHTDLQCGSLPCRPARTKPTAPPRARRPEPSEPKKPAPRAAPAPAPAARPSPTPAPAPVVRPPPSAAKENQPPAPRPPPTDPNMAQCPICQRQFNKDRLEKHQTICEKSSKKKRKVFDPVKMRVKGTESEGYLRKVKGKGKKAEKEPQPAKKDWRKQHEEFIRNIRAAKKAQQHLARGGKLEDLPPPPPMDTSDYVQCPHCNRRFNEAAADRHIPKCASISSNKAKAGSNRSAAAGKPAARAAPARLRR